ncbi:MAG: lysophospholipid acyltransferase family protein [Microbacteriaceae bacterium]
MSERSRPSIFWVLAGLVIPPLSCIVRFSIQGGQKLPKTGAYVIAPNHFSELDPVIVGAALWKLGRVPRFLTKASLFKVPVVGWFLRRSGQIPVQRSGSTRENGPLKAAQALARNGQIVIIYPEGSLTRDPQLWPMRGKTGAVRMALEHDLPIIPVAHWGDQLVLGRYSKKISLFPRRTVQVAIGDPVDLSAFQERSRDSATLNEATDLVMDEITALLESLRGEKAPGERWNPSMHDQKETGRFEG